MKRAIYRTAVIAGVALACAIIAGCVSRRTDGAGRTWLDFDAGSVTNGVWTP
jgi:predicted small secreted protein